ncbi:MAG: flavocytochrome c [Synergistaceae bacterium]|nr:flavocytochrome c [Synergistaceae bacterium]
MLKKIFNNKKIIALIIFFSVLCMCGVCFSSSRSRNPKEIDVDIAIIGAGGAGMTAAIAACEAGVQNIVILEKQAFVGGNTLRASAGFNAANTRYQKAAHIEDSTELFMQDTIKGGKGLNDRELVKSLALNSAKTLDWFNGLGANLTQLGILGGSSVKRTHRPADTSSVGHVIVQTLNKQLNLHKIPVLLETTATKILTNSKGKVCGVEARGKNGNKIIIHCKAVVLATGGFSANQKLVTSYRADLAGFGTTNHPGATGDGIKMAKKLDAALLDMKLIQTHPTVHPTTQTMFTEAVRGNGGILVNKEGKRFVNELATRDIVSAAILKQNGKSCYLVFDDAVRKSLKAIEEYVKLKIVKEANTLEELANSIQVPQGEFIATMTRYGNFQRNGHDPDFGRCSMERPLNQPRFYAAICAPAIHHTMGGVKINTNCEVINKKGAKISGLFAAGEVVGGVHGGNRLAGNAIADIIVFGRIAGKGAADYIKNNGEITSSKANKELTQEETTPLVIANKKGKYKDGKYDGSAPGRHGDIKIRVTVTNGNITKLELIEHNDTSGLLEATLKQIETRMLTSQNTDVEVVSGATLSSNGIIEATRQALQKAR